MEFPSKCPYCGKDTVKNLTKSLSEVVKYTPHFPGDVPRNQQNGLTLELHRCIHCKNPTIQSAQKVEFFRNDKANKIFVRLQADEVFPSEIVQATFSYKFEISCDGYEKIEKTYQIGK